MSEGLGDAPADVRSFLPRPGEPVEDYATRLRALHRDLTLVLEAVERGLAAASGAPPAPEPVIARGETIAAAPEPAGRSQDVRVVPLEEHELRPPGMPAPPPSREGVLRGGPRVEVLPPPSGEQRRAEGEERRAPVVPPAEALGDPGPQGPVDLPGRTPRLPARPSETAPAEEPEPAWVHRGPPSESFTAATYGAPARRGPSAPSPVLLAALVAGWLTVVALALALLLG